MKFGLESFFDTPRTAPSSNGITMFAVLEEIKEDTKVEHHATKGIDTANSQILGEAKCTTKLKGFSPAQAGLYSPNVWQIYKYNGDGMAPQVAIEQTALGCELNLKDGPVKPRPGIDWRMGRRLQVSTVAGKNVQFSVNLASTPDANFDTAQIYSFDGKNVKGVSIEKLSQTPETFVLNTSFPLDATAAEFWLRLVLGEGTINPNSLSLRVAPELSLVANQ